MISFLLILAVLIDLTALSAETKSALDFGISIGMGLAIGAFAVWLFFSEHINKSEKTAPVQQK
jgi:Mg2+/Co2+ transporter CorB